MDSLINTEGISAVANNLIDKIAEAISWKFTKETPQKIAISTYIDDIKNSNFSAEEKAARIYNAKNIVREYSNQHDIIQKAISMPMNEDHTADLKVDWIASFMDKARLISDQNFQQLWARILAGEVERPGSFSLRTLDNLKNISKKEAEAFQKVAKFQVHCEQRCFVFDDALLSRYGVSFEDLMLLEESELINLQPLSLTMTVNNENCLYNDKVVGIIRTLNGNNESVRIEVRSFSQCGRELLQIVQVEEDESYLLEGLNQIKNQYLTRKNEMSITAHRINTIDDKKINYDSKTDLLSACI